eukprot:4121707-Pyramimonas_sp.AAC.1
MPGFARLVAVEHVKSRRSGEEYAGLGANVEADHFAGMSARRRDEWFSKATRVRVATRCSVRAAVAGGRSGLQVGQEHPSRQLARLAWRRARASVLQMSAIVPA